MPISLQVYDSLLLKNIKVIDKRSPDHGTRVDIHIEGGLIKQIGDHISLEHTEQIDSSNLSVSPGWFDYGVYGGTPGLELIERKESLVRAACAGGFTRVALWPEAIPYADTASAAEHISGSHDGTGLRIDLIGALSKSGSGKELAEILNMRASGIVAVSDGHTDHSDDNLVRKALQYCQPLDIPVIIIPKNPELIYGNGINEGEVSTRMGLKGDPVIGELSAIQQNINLADYTQGNLLLHLISSAKSVEAINNVDSNINASVSGFQLCHTDQDLEGYNSFYKQEPALREASDKMALRQAVADGLIKSIVSDHRPRDEESWNVEYMRASAGQSSIELLYGLCETHSDEVLHTDIIVHALSQGNRTCLNIEVPEIKVGAFAELTIFNPSEEWKVETLRSDGKNSAYIGKTLRGKVYGTIIKDRINIIK